MTIKVVNAVAEAFAEKSSLIVTSDAPGINERRKKPLLHHKVKDFDTQQRIFENITVDSIILDNPRRAAGCPQSNTHIPECSNVGMESWLILPSIVTGFARLECEISEYETLSSDWIE